MARELTNRELEEQDILQLPSSITSLCINQCTFRERRFQFAKLAYVDERRLCIAAISKLQQLRSLSFHQCVNLSGILNPLTKLECLEDLEIGNLLYHSVACKGMEFGDLIGTSFKSLKRFRMKDCPDIVLKLGCLFKSASNLM